MKDTTPMAPRTKSSLQDVAEAAGVSIATVSRVLNGIAIVRPDTKERVLRAVARLRYTPDLQARTLRGGDSRTIGMIVSNLNNPFFLDVYESLETEALRFGHEVLVASTGYDPDRLAASVRLMVGRRVSGLAVIVSEMTPALLAELVTTGIPAVVHDASDAPADLMTVRVDYATGMQQVVELLYDAGHRHFAFVGHHATLASLSSRQQAFIDAMRHYGRRVTHRTVTEADSLDGGRRAAHALLDYGARPTAVVCVNDFMATGVIRGLRDRGVRVPTDVSVTGFDNVTLAEYAEPALTTVDIPRSEIGWLAVQRLLQRPVRGKKTQAQESVITPALVVRESTAAAPEPAPELPHRVQYR
jgi:LacI family transcriptional regulator